MKIYYLCANILITLFQHYFKRGESMKDSIHPQFGKCIVKCACGATYETMSTKSEMKVDICSKCHPFFTGKQKLVDTGGRVERFNKRYGR